MPAVLSEVSEEIKEIKCSFAPMVVRGKDGVLYECLDFPGKIQLKGHSPCEEGWNPTAVVEDVLSMKQAAFNAHCFGPFRLFFSCGWQKHMDQDYNLYLGKTLQQRLSEIEGLADICLVDSWANFHLALIQERGETVVVHLSI